MKAPTSIAMFGLALAIAGSDAASARGGDRPTPGPKDRPAAFVEVGPTIHLFSGTQLNPCQCTTLTGYGMREVRVSLVLVRDGDATVVEERSYKWDAWPTKQPPAAKPDLAGGRVLGVLQVQLYKGEKPNRFTVAFGAGFEANAAWSHVQKPREVVLDTDLATTQYTSLRGGKAAGEMHVASVYAIHGANKGELGAVKSIDDVKRKSNEHRGTTYLATTIYWLAE
jgi:hypothetical protein